MTRRQVVAELVAARRARGIPQRTLSTLLGFSPSCVGRWETGRGGPSAEVAVRWLEFLGVEVPANVDELFFPSRPRCGTRRGYSLHLRLGQRCPACWAANATYQRQWRQGRAA